MAVVAEHSTELERGRSCSRRRWGTEAQGRRMERLYRAVEQAWRYWLSRRSNESYLSVEKFAKLTAKLPLPRPRIVYSI